MATNASRCNPTVSLVSHGFMTYRTLWSFSLSHHMSFVSCSRVRENNRIFHSFIHKAVDAWPWEGFFPGGAKVWLFRKSRIFPGGGKNGEISFYPLKLKKQTFFDKNLIGICQISKPRRALAPCPPFRRPCADAVMCASGRFSRSCFFDEATSD